MALLVGGSGDGRGGMAVVMILCHSGLASVGSYKEFHSFAKLSMANEWAEDSFLFLSMSFNVELELLN